MKAEYNWCAENVAMPDIDTVLLQDWIDKVARDHNRMARSLSYIFCDDDKIISVNREFLSHDYYTDIITFDYSRGRCISGDMYISLDTVRSNAEQIGCDYETELHRVIIHGVLHLCGINDKGEGEREIMEQHENRARDMLRDML